jgi:hypothetical protein
MNADLGRGLGFGFFVNDFSIINPPLSAFIRGQ